MHNARICSLSAAANTPSSALSSSLSSSSEADVVHALACPAAQTMNYIEYLGSHAKALFLGAGRLEYPLLGDCCNVCVVHNLENWMERLVLPLFASTGNFILVAFPC